LRDYVSKLQGDGLVRQQEHDYARIAGLKLQLAAERDKAVKLASPDPAGRYEQRAQVLGKLVDEKQAAYGNSFGHAGNVMAILYPNGISLEQMDDALVVVRIIDKLFRIANRKDAFGESPFNDIAGYGLLGADE
jgi:hypothetical protein